MSDEELDRDWKPSSNRPQSTMARSFSLALDDLFKMDNSIADLDAAVSEKKMKVTSQTSELEALEARLRATEERLKAAASGETSPTGRRSGRSSPRPRAPLGDTFSQAKREQPTSPLSESHKVPSRPQTATNRPKTRDGRPVTGRRPTESYSQAPPMPGALPPTPGASEDGDVPPPPPAKDD